MAGFDIHDLRKRMYLKDAELAASVGSSSWPTAIRMWREKYPEDFAGIRNTDHPSKLLTPDNVTL